ncbi:MAG: ParB/RepB/Spo0J family partition protein [Bdellovibrionales bacterium]|nr:ParB/RepB/Spo0J family partition protein [Bdellovibrionales bacterium]
MNKEKRPALGRGLSSLLRTPTHENSSSVVSSLDAPLEVLISEIRLNPRQPRRHFSDVHLEELSKSIAHSGVIQPLIVRRAHPGYELIAGERRLRASKLAGLTKVPVIIRKSTDLDQLEVALVENLQRQDLSPIEEARGYEKLSQDFKLTQEEIAQKVGKDRSTITNLLRLLKLPESVQTMIQKGDLSMGHARALIGVESKQLQETLSQKISANRLSVREVEAMVKSLTFNQAKPTKSAPKVALSANLKQLAEDMQRHLGTRVEIKARNKGGEIKISCFSHQDFTRVASKIMPQ